MDYCKIFAIGKGTTQEVGELPILVYLITLLCFNFYVLRHLAHMP